MFAHHEKQNERSARSTETPAALRGRTAHSAPSYSNTRETKGDSLKPYAVRNGIEVMAVDGTERGIIHSIGTRSVLTLHPIPLDSASPKVAHVDWLAFSFKPSLDGDFRLPLLRQLALLFGLPDIPAKESGGGWNGYEKRLDLMNAQGLSLGLFAHGGERQRGSVHVELNAHACALVKSWQQFETWGETIGARITRVDLAHDDHDGKTFSMENVADWYKDGLFNCGGRQPSHSLHGDWLVDGSPSGRTLYIGKRQNGKMLRFYEKGKQLGDSTSSWVRLELELRGKNRIIPWDCLTSPGKYLAGSYQCLSFLSVVQEKIKTIAKAAAISYTAAVENARQMVGKLVNVMMMVTGGAAFDVIKDLCRDGYPERLKGYADYLPQAFEENHAALVT